ncbi:hypothetical protein MLD38_010534 [Melastoma candidum]|uniref:Uncharacterized protein n=1 Tax=Melastoma candidum TaxID=119954 RepID=A0ACB9R1G2_9MYRT|nr:hypothetical protein MLD38_010534 [Melastoma candidum]
MILQRKLMSKSHMKWKPNKKKHRKITTPLEKLNPDIVVAKDGSGNYTTTNAALKDIPLKGEKTFVIYIKEGVYREQVEFNKNMTNLMIVGDGPTKTSRTPTFRTATVSKSTIMGVSCHMLPI